MPTTPLLPFPNGLEITSISVTKLELQVRVTSNRVSSCCPQCSLPSFAIHSYYRRKPLDLPSAGQQVRVLLSVKKFFCRVVSCPQKIFTERLPELLEPSSRLTSRLRSIVQAIGGAFNGGAYADGAAQGAPQAQQCADRWHLCSNLGEAVERFLIRTQTHLPAPQSTQPEQLAETIAKPQLSSYSATPAQQGRTQASLLRKWKLFERVKELHAEGMSLRKIGEELGLARNTVRKYILY